MTWPDLLKSWPPLLATVALLIAGSWLYKDSQTTVGAALLAAGLVALGVWLAINIRPDTTDRLETQKKLPEPPAHRDEA